MSVVRNSSDEDLPSVLLLGIIIALTAKQTDRKARYLVSMLEIVKVVRVVKSGRVGKASQSKANREWLLCL